MMDKLSRNATWIAAVVALLGAAAGLLPTGKTRGFDLGSFANLPVLEGGRVKPIDTVARNSLLMIRSQQSFRFEEQVDGRTQAHTVGAEEWMLDVLFRPQVADQQPIFVINDPDVLSLIGQRQSSNRYFAFTALLPYIDEIQKQAMVAEQVEAKQRTRFQAAVSNLFQRVYLYYRLKNTVQLERSPGLLMEISSAAQPGAAQRHAALEELADFRPIPPPAGGNPDAWRSTGQALAGAAGGPVDPTLAGWARMGLAWSAGDAQTFNRSVTELRGLVTGARPEALAQAGHELTFNRAQPFYVGMVIYVLALLSIFVSWAWQPELTRRAGFGFLLAGSIVHTIGLVYRIVLQGRPPVTNLYSSAVFVGWGAVLLGAVLERMYRKGFGTAVAAASGFASLIVAHHLTGDGDTMEMMRAVLDSNFWLATHVVTITIGYSGTFLAAAIAIGWSLRQQLARVLDENTSKTLYASAYGIICFSLFFSFLGTVLGGIWADQSWGRFWGWDPKENGALLIVLWNAIILHARWGGYVRERGVMSMAIFGAIITSCSWFGVNMLGVGLHSYGFMDSAFWALLGVCTTLGVLALLALAPRHFWKGGAAAREARASS